MKEEGKAINTEKIFEGWKNRGTLYKSTRLNVLGIFNEEEEEVEKVDDEEGMI